MPRTHPGEVWLVDLGMVAKTRPCLILSDYPLDNELALIVVVPHTTAARHNRWEISIPKSFLKPGVFHLQQIQASQAPVPYESRSRRSSVVSDCMMELFCSRIASASSRFACCNSAIFSSTVFLQIRR